MIEIVEKPTMVCSYCRCKFSYDKEDLTKTKIKTLDLKYYRVVACVKCPLCDNNNFVYETREERDDC